MQCRQDKARVLSEEVIQFPSRNFNFNYDVTGLAKLGFEVEFEVWNDPQ